MRLKFYIIKELHMFLSTAYPFISWPNYWSDLVLLIENWKHEMKATQVCWTKPYYSMVKLNTNGSALGNFGKIWVGGILRDSEGK